MKLIVDRVLPVDNCDVYYKPFYRRDDFDDERYKPVFSPTVFSGQTMKVRMIPHYYPDGKNWSDGKLFVRPYVLTAVRKERYDGILFLIVFLQKITKSRLITLFLNYLDIFYQID